MQIHLNREKSLDTLRGIAVLLMVSAHAVAFFFTGENPILWFVRMFGDMVSFVIFAFVSGATCYFAYLDFPQNREHVIRLSRSIKLLQVYYLAAFASALGTFAATGIEQWPELIVKVLLLIVVPEYTEFIFTFVLFTLFLYIVQEKLKSLIRSETKLIAISILSYMAGYLIYTSVSSEPLVYYTSLIAGYADWFRFPFLQYLPVLLTGIYVGKLIDRDTPKKFRRLHLSVVIAIFAIITIVSVLDPTLSAWPYQNDFSRWPPSIGFLSVGLTTSLVLITLLSRVIKLPGLIADPLNLLGTHALGFFATHIMLFEIVDTFFPWINTDNSLLMVLLIIMTFIICYLIIKAWNAVNSKQAIDKNSNKSYNDYRLSIKRFMQISLRNTFIFIVIVGIIAAAIVWALRCNLSLNFTCGGVDQIQAKDDKESVLGKNTDALADEAVWWNGEYQYSKSLTVSNISPVEELPVNSLITAEFNHQELVNAEKALIDGKDIKLIYFTEEGYVEVPFEITNLNAPNTKLEFNLIEGIEALGNTDRYCLYYGNKFVQPEFDKEPISVFNNVNYTVEFNSENINPIQSDTNRKWMLKDVEEYSNLELTLQIADPDIRVEKAEFDIVGEDMEGRMIKQSNDKFTSEIEISELPVGTYQIRSSITTTNGVELSATTQEFIVSFPLYVTWSIDWEGMDTSNATLKSMEEFSSNHGVPIIQLWNPRAHLVLNNNRLNQLLSWIKEREAQGDEIGLHTHMFTDMVAAAGVEPKREPNWASERNKSGSDTPAYVYSYEEHIKLLNWAKDQFSAKGLSQPKSYRAGGWMADINLIKALDETGFLIDTSGRTQHSMGEYKVRELDQAANSYIIRPATNEEIQQYLASQNETDGEPGFVADFVEHRVEGKWDLQPITKPYQISASNINFSMAPRLSVWEFPNNGADSWHFGTNTLIERFDTNFDGKPVSEAQVVTYLTHPHSIHIDMQKLEPTFDHIDTFTAKSDNGPVIYSTFKEPYEYLTGESYR